VSDPEYTFDFDAWKDLAQRDPRAFFRRRERTIMEFIAAHPEHQEDLLRLQLRIDNVRAVSGTPDQAVRHIFGMLDTNLQALTASLQALRQEAGRLSSAIQKTEK